MARILVIEDNVTNLDLMLYLLQAFGHTPLSAIGGEAGLDIAQRERLDLIICDVQMPDIDGYEVARRLKDDPALRTIPLVAVTALAMVGDRDKVLAAGFDGYIAKPIAPETFVAQVQAFLPPQPCFAQVPKEEHPPPSSLAFAPVPHTTLLVVDNIQPNIELVRAQLEPFGYRIIAATEVRAGLTLARQHSPALILSDVHMPGEDGFAFVRAVKADPQLQAVPFVFLSSTSWRATDQHRALTLGAAKFLSRPLEPGQLLKEIEDCLRR